MSKYNIDEIIKSVSRVPFIPPAPFGIGVKPEEYQNFVLSYLVRDIDGLSILHQLGLDLSDCIVGDSDSARLTSIIEFYLEKHDPDRSLRTWWIDLYRNPCAIELLKKKILDKDFKWDEFAKNHHPDAIKIIEQNLDKLDLNHGRGWEGLCMNENPDVIPIIEKNLDKLNKHAWYYLSGNHNAIHILEKNPDKINWYYFSYNRSDRAVEILKKNPDKIEWMMFSQNRNPNAILIIKNNLDKVVWVRLTTNSNAMDILEKNPDKIDMRRSFGIFLNSHPKAANFLEKNLDKVEDWGCLAINQAFTEKYFHPPGNTVSDQRRISIIIDMFGNYKPKKHQDPPDNRFIQTINGVRIFKKSGYW